MICVIFIVGESRAALQISEHVVPGITDLTGEETDRIDLGLILERHTTERANRAGVGALQIASVPEEAVCRCGLSGTAVPQ